MNASISLEETFRLLPRSEQEAIIRHGTAIRLSDLRNRLFLAQSKVRHFEETYATTLETLEREGLPDDAGYTMHEDYIMWHHWSEVTSQLQADIAQLEEIAQHGLLGREPVDAGN